MVDLGKRTRKVNINQMPEEQFEQLMEQLGDKLREIVDEACEKANKLSKPYGFQVKMQFAAEPLEQPSKE